jgi:hypothetical protein
MDSSFNPSFIEHTSSLLKLKQITLKQEIMSAYFILNKQPKKQLNLGGASFNQTEECKGVKISKDLVLPHVKRLEDQAVKMLLVWLYS